MSSSPIFWQRCIAAFREELTPQQFNTWIRPLAVEGADEGYRLLAPNRFVLQWVKERFAERIGELAAAAEGHPVPITLAVREAAVETPPAEPAPLPAIPVPAPAVQPAARRHEQTSLNPTFTFASFVAGKANQLGALGFGGGCEKGSGQTGEGQGEGSDGHGVLRSGGILTHSGGFE